MTLRWAGTAISGLVLSSLIYLSLFPPGPIPPIGPLLDPVHGAWGTARSAELPEKSHGTIPGLTGTVDVRYDDRGVPHIFAISDGDATRALGYVVARDRLFQLEMQARAGAGRLTEIVGPLALPLDREMRQLGLPDAARRKLATLPPGELAMLQAFADGANAWIDSHRSEIPLEYLLLGRKPERWSPINSLQLLGRMGYTLAHSDLESLHSEAVTLVGQSAADALYPVQSPIQEPLQPNGQRSPRFADLRLPSPERATARSSSRVDESDPGFDALGSDNWAVAPVRTAAGHALLAGDQHLDLTLPAIWYEVQMSVAGSLDAYGVTIPGAASIVLGFNRDIAWTATNTEADVLDHYAEVVDDQENPTRYQVDGAWRPLRVEIERYLGPRGRLIATDTQRFTHRGPLNRRAHGWESTRWTVLEAGDESLSLNGGMRAKNVAGYFDSMAGFRAPAQNFLVADREGAIAIRSTGRIPLRPGGRGDVMQQGDQSANDWTGDWKLTELPQSIRPAQGYLASANQQPIDPLVDPRYLAANWLAPWRAIRINQLLRSDSLVTPDAMRRFQTDPGSPMADWFVPAFLAAGRKHSNNPSIRRATELLAQWDRRYTLDNTRAVLFEAAMRQLPKLLWDELGGNIAPPSSSVTAMLLRDSASVWWDDRRTEQVEDRDRLLARALDDGLQEVLKSRGEPDAGGWRWDRIRYANIYHLLQIPSLSALRVPVQGGQSTLNPSSGRGTFGPSWRMVVELGTEVKAWGTYPGGQSGNPASSRYLTGLAKWRDGELDSLRFPRRATELGVHQVSVLTLSPATKQ